MSRIQNISRRDFLKQTGATGALVLGAQIVPGSMVAAVRAQGTGMSVAPNLFVAIADDGIGDHHLQPLRDGPGRAHRHSHDPRR